MNPGDKINDRNAPSCVQLLLYPPWPHNDTTLYLYIETMNTTITHFSFVSDFDIVLLWLIGFKKTKSLFTRSHITKINFIDRHQL